MNREIKFRGLDENGGFIYGNLFKNDFATRIIPFGAVIFDGEKISDHIVVDEATIGQFTGLKDKNGKEIYEGDICRILYSDWPSNTNPEISLEDYLISISSVGEIQFHAPCFYIMLIDRYGDPYPNHMRHGKHGFIEVIGNIHENPELLNA